MITKDGGGGGGGGIPGSLCGHLGLERELGSLSSRSADQLSKNSRCMVN